MEKILIVEDEQNIREVLQDILELAGYEVQMAENGKSGYNAIIESTPDLVLCDVNMPDLNGFDLLLSLNQVMKDQVIPPFIFVTAKVEKEDIRKGLNLGADDYIMKPFNHKHILEVVRMRLDKRQKIAGHNPINEPITASNSSTFDKLGIPNENGLDLVPFENIIRCEADRAYCKFVLTGSKKIVVSKPMKEFEEVLAQNGFFKIHKSIIINLNHIEKYLNGAGGEILMTDGSLVPVSVRKKKEVLQILKNNFGMS